MDLEKTIKFFCGMKRWNKHKFSDPRALVRNTADYGYDVYSLGIILIYDI